MGAGTTLLASLSVLDQRQLAYGSFVSLRHRLVYVETPKVACSAMKHLFAALEGETGVEEANRGGWEIDPELLLHGRAAWKTPSLLDLRADLLDEALASRDFHRFCFVRNPFTRVFSGWQSKVMLREPLQIGPFATKDFYQREIRGLEDLRLAFEGFLEYLYREEWPEIMNPHWAQQTGLLMPERIAYSAIGKVEELADALGLLEAHLAKRQTRLPRLPRSNQGLLPWDPLYLTPRAEELVQLLYGADFERFGYERTPPGGRGGTASLETALRAMEMIRGRHQRFSDIHALLDDANARLALLARQHEQDDVASTESRERARTVERELSCLKTRLDKQALAFDAALAERDQLIERQRAALDAAGGEMQEVSQRLADLERSISWRTTRPLRAVRRFLQRVVGGLPRRWRARSEAKLVRASGLFDTAWYLRMNPDVAEARIDPLRHYLIAGAFESRDPNPLFDSSWYLSRNPDVAAAGLNPLVHFLMCGTREGRNPGPAFDTALYLREHPELTGAHENPLAHRLRTGGGVT